MLAWLESLRADAVFGWRQLKKHWVTSAAAILSLALGIGACTSAFRLIDALLLRPLPVPNPDRLYSLSRQGLNFDGKPSIDQNCEYPLFLQMRAAVKDRAELLALSYADRVDLSYRPDQEIEKAYVQYVSGWMFESFGLRPVYMAALFYEVKPTDLAMLAFPWLALLGTAVLASLPPVARAARIDPVTLLSAE
jgi:putative ABC transport system permease protein